MTWWKWAILATVGCLGLVATGAAMAYLYRTETTKSIEAWTKVAHQMAHEQADSVRAVDERFMVEFRKAAAAGVQHATTGATHDTAAAVTDGLVVALLDSLHHAQSALDSLLYYPPIVAGQQHEITELRAASSSWQSAYRDQVQATDKLLGRIDTDSAFQRRVLAHLDSAPKPPRVSLFNLLIHPKPYLKGEWGTKTGFELKAGGCVGSCGGGN